MQNFLNLIDYHLACEGREPWLAGIENSLLQYAETRLLQPRGLSLQSYGTTRYLQRDSSAPLLEISRVRASHGLVLLIESLSHRSFERYQKIGLRQRRWERSDDIDVFQTIAEAVAYFASCPPLNIVVAHLLRNVHILEVDDSSIDLSHSDPEVPLSAFISVPPKSAPHAALRVCESLLHECMHLQLSLVERNVALVTHKQAICPSPWRAELRPPSGLVHGIYVFNAINAFLRRLERVTEEHHELEYIRRRQAEIEPEVEKAHRSLNAADLTPTGTTLLSVSDPTIGGL